MPHVKSQAKHLKKARNCRKLIQEKIQKDVKMNYIMKNVDDSNIEEVINYINNLNKNDSVANKKRLELIKYISSLPNSEIENAHSLFKTMLYTKGNNTGKILFPYFQ